MSTVPNLIKNVIIAKHIVYNKTVGQLYVIKIITYYGENIPLHEVIPNVLPP